MVAECDVITKSGIREGQNFQEKMLITKSCLLTRNFEGNHAKNGGNINLDCICFDRGIYFELIMSSHRQIEVLFFSDYFLQIKIAQLMEHRTHSFKSRHPFLQFDFCTKKILPLNWYQSMN